MAQPIIAWVASILPTTSAGQSGSVTFTFQMTAGFEAYFNINAGLPGTTSVSAGPEVDVYRSTDGGATYETIATVAAVFPTLPIATVQTRQVLLTTGYWAIRLQTGGGVATTVSFQVNTAMVITAYS